MRAFHNLKILAKLAIPVSLLVLVAAGLVFIAMQALGSMKDRTNYITDVTAPRLVLSLQMAYAMSEATLQVKNAIIDPKTNDTGRAKAVFEEEKAKAVAAADRLFALADTEERRSLNAALNRLLQKSVAGYLWR